MPEFESAVTKTYPSDPDARIVVADESSRPKTLVRSDQPQFGVVFGSSTKIDDTLVCGTRPDEWLILGEVDGDETANGGVDMGGFTNVIPFTHGRSLFRVTGDPATSMLEKVCGIDWSDQMTPNGAVFTASVALTTCDVIRDDLDDTRSYLLMCDRSFGQYLFDALLEAGDEFGVVAS